jgi:hypothetical protein
MFRPGPLSPGDADALSRLAAQVGQLQGRVERSAALAIERFPALWTAYDVATGRGSWTEQWFDAGGDRVTRVGGRTGTPTFMPAYPVGGGAIPSFAAGGSGSGAVAGVEVELRRRIVATDTGVSLGPVYEFDWPDSGTGGGGSGTAGSVITPLVYSERVPGTVTSATVGGNQEAHATSVMTLPEVGWYHLILNLCLRSNVGYPLAASVWIQEETYGGGPAAGSGVFYGPGEDNAGDAPFGPVAYSAYWQIRAEGANLTSSDGGTFNLSTLIGTTAANVRLGIRTLSAGAAGAHTIVGTGAGDPYYKTSLTAVRLHWHTGAT